VENVATVPAAAVTHDSNKLRFVNYGTVYDDINVMCKQVRSTFSVKIIYNCVKLLEGSQKIF